MHPAISEGKMTKEDFERYYTLQIVLHLKCFVAE